MAPSIRVRPASSNILYVSLYNKLLTATVHVKKNDETVGVVFLETVSARSKCVVE